MKRIIISAAIVLSSFAGFGQDSYTIKMNMKIDGLPAEYAAFGEQETITYIKGEKSKTEINGMMGSQIMLTVGENHTFLTDAMGNKTGYTATTAEMEAFHKKSAEDMKPKIEYTTEKKMIAGYECTKAIVTSVDKEKKEAKIIVWVTDKIKSDLAKKSRGAGKGMMDLGDIKGYPLEMEMKQSQQGTEMKITMTASEVSTAPIADGVFAVSTAGYKMMTYKEAMEKMKSGPRAAE